MCSIKGLIKFDFSVSVYIHVRVICVRMGSSRRHRAVFFFAVLRDVAMTRAHNFGACAHHDLRLLEWLFDLLHPFLKFSLGLKDETFQNEFLISLSNNGYQEGKGTNKIDLEMFSVLSRAKVWGSIPHGDSEFFLCPTTWQDEKNPFLFLYRAQTYHLFYSIYKNWLNFN